MRDPTREKGGGKKSFYHSPTYPIGPPSNSQYATEHHRQKEDLSRNAVSPFTTSSTYRYPPVAQQALKTRWRPVVGAMMSSAQVNHPGVRHGVLIWTGWMVLKRIWVGR